MRRPELSSLVSGRPTTSDPYRPRGVAKRVHWALISTRGNYAARTPCSAAIRLPHSENPLSALALFLLVSRTAGDDQYR